MANQSDVPNDYTDQYWADLAAKAEQQYKLPHGVVQSIVTHGERSNNDQVSEAGARTPFQITPETRKAIIKKYDIDPYLNPKNAADASALLIKESLDRNNGDIHQAISEYHGGTDRNNWGKKTHAYTERVKGGIGEKAIDKALADYDTYLANQNNPKFEAQKLTKNDMLIEQALAKYDEHIAKNGPNPDQAEVSPNSPNVFQKAADLVTGDLRKVPQTEALESIDSMPEFNGLKSLMNPNYWKAAIGTTFTNPQETAQIIQANFPNVKVNQDAKGNYVFTSAENGKDYAIHPGLEMSDVPRVIGEGVIMSPGGRGLAAAGEGLLHVAGGKVLNAGLRQAAVEGTQAATGGNFDPEQVAATGLLSAVPEAAQALKPTVMAGVDAVKQPLKNVLDSLKPKVATEVVDNVGNQARSGGAAAVNMDQYRQDLGQSLGFQTPSTKGQLTRNEADQQFERETAKDMEKGQLLRERFQNQLHEVHNKFDEFFDETRATTKDPIQAGNIVKKAVQDKSDLKLAEVRNAYRVADASPEGLIQVSIPRLVNMINDEISKSATVALPHDVERLLLHHNFAVRDVNGILQPNIGTVRQAERLYKDINNKISQHQDKNSFRLGSEFKSLINEATNEVAGPLYANAKRLRYEYGKQFENREIIDKLLKTDKGKLDQKVENSQVIHHLLFGSDSSPEALRHARRVIQTSPNGMQAWDEVRGQTLKHIEDMAFSNNTTNRLDERLFSQSKYEGILKKIGEEKLKIIFGKANTALLEDINEYTKHIFTTTPDAALNSSNNAGKIVTGIFDIVLSGSLGNVPIPAATLARLGLKHIKDRAIRNRIMVHLNYKPKP